MCSGFLRSVDQRWLIRFLEHRIGDKRILRLIQKWLKVGVLEDGIVTVSETGTGQGAVISPLLANIYLHYVFDLWAEQWRGREAQGDMIMVRYADDVVLGFEHEADARRFLGAMQARLEKFSLALHPDKTRLIAFGRFAADQRARAGLGKPETFDFLGFTFISGKTRRANSSFSGKPVVIARRPSCGRSKTRCEERCTCPFLSKEAGLDRSSPAISPTTPCRVTSAR